MLAGVEGRLEKSSAATGLSRWLILSMLVLVGFAVNSLVTLSQRLLWGVEDEGSACRGVGVCDMV